MRRLRPTAVGVAQVALSAVLIASLVSVIAGPYDSEAGAFEDLAFIVPFSVYYVLFSGSLVLALGPGYRLEVRILWERWARFRDPLREMLGSLGTALFALGGLYFLLFAGMFVTLRRVGRLVTRAPAPQVVWNVDDGTVRHATRRDRAEPSDPRPPRDPVPGRTTPAGPESPEDEWRRRWGRGRSD